MAFKFGILPPPEGTDKKLDVLFLPDLEVLMKVIEGDLGITDKVRIETLVAILATTEDYIRENVYVVDIFSKFFHLKLKNPIDYYIDNNIKTFPKSEFISDGTDERTSLKAFEKSFFQALFETHKPYLQAILIILKNLVRIEDGIARSLALVAKSQKPKTNPKALGYKYADMQEKITKLKAYAKPKKPTKFGFAEFKMTEGNDPNTIFDWQVLKTEYSTGEKVEGLDYEVIYNDIEEDKVIFDQAPDIIEDDDEEQREKPPVVIFAVIDDKGRIISSPNSWITGSGKFYGNFEILEKPNRASIKKLESAIREQTIYQMLKKGLTPNPDDIKKVVDSVDVNENINDLMDNSFLSLLDKKGDKGLEIGNDNQKDVNKVTKKKKGVIVGKTITYKGKKVYLDPEGDYILQVVKVDNDKNQPRNQSHLKNKYPLVGNYQGVNAAESLEKGEYKIRSGSQGRIQTVVEYKSKGKKEKKSEPYYVIEGIIADRPSAAQSRSNSASYYGKRHFPSAIKIFIKIVIEIITKTTPILQDLIKLFKDPFGFIVGILLEKLKEYEFFNQDIVAKFAQLVKIKGIDKKKEFIAKDPTVKKYFYLDEEGKLKFVFNGVGAIDLFGFSFGAGISNFLPTFLFQKTGGGGMGCNDVDTQVNGYGQNLPKNDKNANEKKVLTSKTIVEETESIQYSTGTFKEGVDYDYIYLSEEVEQLLSENEDAMTLLTMNEADFQNMVETLNEEDDGDNVIKTLQTLLSAYRKNPSNTSIENKIYALRNKMKFIIISIFQLPLQLLMLPIKIVICIVEYIINFFTNLKFKTLPKDMAYFLSFKWILDFFKPSKILGIIGINFDPSLLPKWLDEIKGLSDDERATKLYDVNKIFSMPCFVQMPKYTADQLLELGDAPLRLITPLLNLLTMVINAIIDFLWNLLNLDKILKTPTINLKGLANKNVSPEVLYQILNGEDSEEALNALSESFLYTVTLPDGTVLEDIDQTQLDAFIKTHANLDFAYQS